MRKFNIITHYTNYEVLTIFNLDYAVLSVFSINRFVLTSYITLSI